MEGPRIKRLRLQLGLSQERFAHLLGVSLQTVRRWEEGLTRPLPIISLKLEEIRREIDRAQPRGGAGPPRLHAQRPSIRRLIKGRGGVPMSPRREEPEVGITVDLGLGGLFKGIGNLLDLIAQMAEEGKEEYARSGEAQLLGGKAKGVYGFSIKLGLGGKPIVEEFGNIRTTERGPVVAEVREPLVDVLDEGERLVVIAELPGVEQEDIHVEVKDDILEITAETEDKKYAKEVLLPSPVDAHTLETSCKNGILTIKLAKK